MGTECYVALRALFGVLANLFIVSLTVYFVSCYLRGVGTAKGGCHALVGFQEEIWNC